MASGDLFHFIDLSAQNAINQYHFITTIVSWVFNRLDNGNVTN